MRARSRQLFKNDPYCQRFAALMRKNIIGPNGFRLKNRAIHHWDEKTKRPVYDGRDNNLIEVGWWDWSKPAHCTVQRNLTLVDAFGLALETAATDGECFIQLIHGFSNPHGFALRFIPADCLDENHNEDLGGGRMIRMGIELDEWRAPVAYHVYRGNPVDYYGRGTSMYSQRQRIPAAEMIHLGRRTMVGQTRCVPWLFASMLLLNHLGSYAESEVIASRIAAGKLGFIEKGPDGEFSGDGEDENGQTVIDAEPGTFTTLDNGSKVHTFDPQHPNASFEAFVRAMLRGVACAGDVAYHSLTGDLNSVNYSSARIGLLDERDGYVTLQTWFSAHVCDRVFKEWLDSALLTQKVPLPYAKFDKFNAPTWRGRRWTWVDPEKELNAAKLALELGITSRRKIIEDSTNTEDPEEIWSELAEENRELLKAGVIKDDTKPAPAPRPAQQPAAE